MQQDEEAVGQEIAEAAEAAEERLPSDPQSILAALEQRVAALETVEEDVRQRELASAEYVGYIKELREELTVLRRMRLVYGSFAIAIVGLLSFLLVALVFASGSPLPRLPEHTAAILIVALVTGIVVVILALARGVHRSSVERGKEDTMVSVPSLVTELVRELGQR